MTPETRLHWIERIVNSLGVPVVILGVLGYASYEAAGWLSPYVERVLESHIDFVNASSDTLQRLDAKSDQSSAEHLLITETLTDLVDELHGR